MGGMYIDRMMHFPNGFLLLHVTKTHQNDVVCHYLLILWSSGYKRWSRVFSFLDGCDFNLWGRHGIHVLWSRGTNRSSIKRKNLLRKKSWELLPLLLKKNHMNYLPCYEKQSTPVNWMNAVSDLYLARR